MTPEFLRELERKAIHTSSLWMGFVIYFCSEHEAFAIFLVALAGLLSFEVLRYVPSTRAWVPSLLTRTLRAHETGARFTLTGASYVVLSGLLALWLFPKMIAITALAIMSVGDSAAALVGRGYGRIKFWNKSLEGSAAFVLASFATVLAIHYLLPTDPRFLLAALGACFAGALAEVLASPLKLDDNLTITLGAGSAMVLVYAF